MIAKKNIQKAINISKILSNFYNYIKVDFSKIKELKNVKKKISRISPYIEYFEIRNKYNLSKNINKNNFKIFISYYIKNIRLIDNF